MYVIEVNTWGNVDPRKESKLDISGIVVKPQKTIENHLGDILWHIEKKGKRLMNVSLGG